MPHPAWAGRPLLAARWPAVGMLPPGRPGPDHAGWLAAMTLLAWVIVEAGLRVRHWHRQGHLAAALQPGLLGRLRPRDWTFAAIIVSFPAALVLGMAAARLSWARIGPSGHDAAWDWALALAGAVLAVAGMGLRVWAILTLDHLFTYVVRVGADHQLVDRGPDRRLRHPGYAGALLVPLGVGATLGSWLSLLLAVGIPSLALCARIGKEERALALALGGRYQAYSGRTQRWSPGSGDTCRIGRDLRGAGQRPSGPSRPAVGPPPGNRVFVGSGNCGQRLWQG